MPTFEEYKELLADHLKGLSDAEIAERYQIDTTFAAFVLKRWFLDRREHRTKCGKVAGQQP